MRTFDVYTTSDIRVRSLPGDIIEQKRGCRRMNADELKSMQAPLKARFRSDPSAACITLRATGAVTCKVDTGKALIEAGLHPATGGDGTFVCVGRRRLMPIQRHPADGYRCAEARGGFAWRMRSKNRAIAD